MGQGVSVRMACEDQVRRELLAPCIEGETMRCQCLPGQTTFTAHLNSEIAPSLCSLEASDLREYRVVITFCMMSDNLADSTNAELSMQSCGGVVVSPDDNSVHVQGTASSEGSTRGSGVLLQSQGSV